MKSNTIIICIGNDLRGDDGFAKAVGEKLNKQNITTVLFAHQLLPEHVLEIIKYDHVIFIDAKYGEEVGKIEVLDVCADNAKLEAFGHYQTPANIVFMAKTLYDKNIKATIITAQTIYFDEIDCLSEEIKKSVDKCILEIALIFG